MQFVIFFSGLRGAVAFSCSNIFPDMYGHRDVIICTTTSIILITTFLQGLLIVPVISIAQVAIGSSSSNNCTSRMKTTSPLHVEERYIYPLVIKNRFSPRFNRDSSLYASPESNYLGSPSESKISPDYLSSQSSGGGYPSDSDESIDSNESKIPYTILSYYILFYMLILHTVISNNICNFFLLSISSKNIFPSQKRIIFK